MRGAQVGTSIGKGDWDPCTRPGGSRVRRSRALSPGGPPVREAQPNPASFPGWLSL